MIGTRGKINVIIVIKFNYVAKTEKKNQENEEKYNLIDSKNENNEAILPQPDVRRETIIEENQSLMFEK